MPATKKKSTKKLGKIAIELNAKPTPAESFVPAEGDETEVRTYLINRIKVLKDARKKNLRGLSKSIEDIWREIDREYTPHELNTSTSTRKRVVTDDDLGLRGRMVKIGDPDGWQANQATPDFYVKVNTALSILVEQNPEATFDPVSKKYQENTHVAEAIWKQSWFMSGGKRALKTGIFNMSRYGIGFWVTRPKIDIRKKRVLVAYHPEDPEKNEYEDRQVVRYNGLTRESINPWNMWVDDTARPGCFDDIGDDYYEKEYSEEAFKAEFPEAVFPNAKFCTPNEMVLENDRKSTDPNPAEKKYIVGFYENCRKDLYCCWYPGPNIPLYSSPLPNDDGKLGLWFAPWTLRADDSIYGIGIFEIVRGDTILYDRISNMTVDQLTLSIYKSFFHKGVDQIGEEGILEIMPGRGQQVSDPKAIEWLNVPGPGQDAWRGMQFLQERRDVNSGVPSQLAGKFGGKTLGQDLQAKEAALERLKLPLDFIVDALEQEAYITLSWLTQILSTPEMLEFTDEQTLRDALQEVGLSEEEIKQYLETAANPQDGQELISQDQGSTPPPMLDENGQPTGEQAPVAEPKKYANVYPEVSMNLQVGDAGTLFESDQRRFYRFGVNLPLKRLDWKGIVRIIPQSVLVPSKELMRRLDLDLFNLVYPSIQAMVANPGLVPALINPIKEIIGSFGKDHKDWLDEKFFMKLYEDSQKPKDMTGANVKPTLTVAFSDLDAVDKNGVPKRMTPAQTEVLKKYYGITIEQPMFVPSGTQGMGGASSSGGSTPPGSSPDGGAGPLPPEMSTKSGIEAPQVADIGQAPSSMAGAVEAANRSA